MSALSARTLGAVVAAAFVITSVATAGIAGSATAASQSRTMAVAVAEPISAVVPASTRGIEAGVGTWQHFAKVNHAGSRSYYVYTPPGLAPGATVPLVVVLHGCRQSASLALGSGVNALADRKGFVVVYPEQSISDNPRRCWNWFDVRDQVRGFGEPAEIAAITGQVTATEFPGVGVPAQVEVWKDEGGSLSLAWSGLTDMNGNYESNGLQTGTYYVLAYYGLYEECQVYSGQSCANDGGPPSVDPASASPLTFDNISTQSGVVSARRSPDRPCEEGTTCSVFAV